MKTKIRQFDIAEHLETDDDIRGFLKEVASTGDATDLVHALNIASRARGMTQVAEKAGITRTSLYKSLAEDGNPQLKTISKVAEVFGCKLILG